MPLIKEIPVSDEQLAGCDESAEFMEHFPCFVDFPKLRSPSGEVTWENVAHFETRAAAVQWLKDKLGAHAIDDDGRVSLIS